MVDFSSEEIIPMIGLESIIFKLKENFSVLLLKNKKEFSFTVKVSLKILWKD